MGIGELVRARTIAFSLALESRDGGPAAHLASVPAFVQLIINPGVSSTLPNSTRDAPVDNLDALAAVSLRWLLVRGRSNRFLTQSNGKTSPQIDPELHHVALDLRTLFGHSAFRQVRPNVESAAEFEQAQADCIDALVAIGRRAAGLLDFDD